MQYVLSVETKGHTDIIDITEKVREHVQKSEIRDGMCCVFVRHSTCAVTTMEYEPGLIEDMRRILESIAPKSDEYEHNKKWGDGNGHAHIRASLIGPSVCVPIHGGRLELGTWQQIVLIDCDNRPRERTVIVSMIIEEASEK